MSDDVDVKCAVLSSRAQALHDVMRLICSHLVTDESQTLAQAMDVGIYGEDGAVIAEEQNDGSRLWSNPVDANLPLTCFLNG